MTYRDIRMKMLEDELVTAIGECNDARREVTRLSNYETSYNNLRRVVDSQYNTINALHSQLARMEDESDEAVIARDEAQGALTTAHKVIEDMDAALDVQRDNHNLVVGAYESRVGQLRESLREARAALAEEKVVTDTAIRAMEEAEVELAKERERFTITLGEYADRIAELSDNNRILRDGWTADNKKLLDVQLALPAIIFGVVYYDLGEHGITWKVCVERWKRYWAPAMAEAHSGDCTNECHSCARCQAEDVMKLVDIVRKGLNDDE